MKYIIKDKRMHIKDKIYILLLLLIKREDKIFLFSCIEATQGSQVSSLAALVRVADEAWMAPFAVQRQAFWSVSNQDCSDQGRQTGCGTAVRA